MNKTAILIEHGGSEPLEVARLQSVGQALSDVWHHRELLYFLVWKDIKVKYKQTVLGVAWVILQPLIGMGLSAVLLQERVAWPLVATAVGVLGCVAGARRAA
jgi:ABC-type polysaccharide/polyol phosphate export permease